MQLDGVAGEMNRHHVTKRHAYPLGRPFYLHVRTLDGKAQFPCALKDLRADQVGRPCRDVAGSCQSFHVALEPQVAQECGRQSGDNINKDTEKE